MLMVRLPTSRKLLESADISDIANALRSVVGNTASFSHFDTIEEAPRSGRLLLQRPIPSSVAWPCPYLPFTMAKELMKKDLLLQDRFVPPRQPPELFAKGWEVHRTVIEGTAAVLVWATWIPVRSHAMQ